MRMLLLLLSFYLIHCHDAEIIITALMMMMMMMMGEKTTYRRYVRLHSHLTDINAYSYALTNGSRERILLFSALRPHKSEFRPLVAIVFSPLNLKTISSSNFALIEKVTSYD